MHQSMQRLGCPFLKKKTIDMCDLDKPINTAHACVSYIVPTLPPFQVHDYIAYIGQTIVVDYTPCR